MLKNALESDVSEGNVCEYESGLPETITTSCLKAYKTDDISEVRSNSASIAGTCDCSFVKELNAGKLALWTKWSVFIVAAVPTAEAIVSAFQAVRSVETK
jgi:hypothetical protein